MKGASRSAVEGGGERAARLTHSPHSPAVSAVRRVSSSMARPVMASPTGPPAESASRVRSRMASILDLRSGAGGDQRLHLAEGPDALDGFVFDRDAEPVLDFEDDVDHARRID